MSTSTSILPLGQSNFCACKGLSGAPLIKPLTEYFVGKDGKNWRIVKIWPSLTCGMAVYTVQQISNPNNILMCLHRFIKEPIKMHISAEYYLALENAWKDYQNILVNIKVTENG